MHVLCTPCYQRDSQNQQQLKYIVAERILGNDELRAANVFTEWSHVEMCVAGGPAHSCQAPGPSETVDVRFTFPSPRLPPDEHPGLFHLPLLSSRKCC